MITTRARFHLTLALAGCLAAGAAGSPALAQTATAPIELSETRDARLIAQVREVLDQQAVALTLESRNAEASEFGQAEIDALDTQWRKERESNDQPLITAVLAGPLSAYLLQMQASSLGLYSEIFVMDANGLNAGQSAITSDYWQGDEAKFQKTFPVGPDAVFIDEAEFNEDTGTWRAQVNLTLTDPHGNAIGAATVEMNLTELQRRKLLGLNS